jgi:Ca-activated chloride channel family protein
MTKCNDIQDRLAEEGAALAQRDDTVRGHIEGCADCSAFLENLTRVESALRDLPDHDAPDALVAKTLGAVRQAQGEDAARPGLPFPRRGLAAALAASVVIVASLGILQTLQPMLGSRNFFATQNRVTAEPADIFDRRYAGAPRLGEREQTVVGTSDVLSAEPNVVEFEEALKGDRSSVAKAKPLPPPQEPESEVAELVEPEPEGDPNSELDIIAQLEGPIRSLDSEDLARGALAKNKAHAAADRDGESTAGEDKELAGGAFAFGNEEQTAGAGGTVGRVFSIPSPSETPAQQYRGDEKKRQEKAEEAELRESSQRQIVQSIERSRSEAAPVSPSQVAQLPAGGYLADEAFDDGRRANRVGPTDPEDARLRAKAFLARYASLDALTYQTPIGYWANTYIPGDPAIRLLQARLKSGKGRADLVEQTVRQVRQPFDAPRDAALAVYLQADRTAIQGPTRMRLQVGLKGAERQGGRRPAMNVGLVLDMRSLAKDGTGPRIRALVDAMARSRQPGDRFSLTVAGPGGGLVVPPEAFRHGPLSVALARLFETSRRGGAPGVALPEAVLLATESVRNAVGGIPLSVVSLGGGADPDDIDRLVAAGQGARRVLHSAEAADALVDRELHASSRAVARALRLRIRLAPGVKLIEVLGSRRLEAPQAQRVRQAEQAIDRRLARNFGIQADRSEDEEGIQIVIPSFYAGDSHVVLLDVVVERPGPVADVTLRYKDLAFLKNGVAEAGLTIRGGTGARDPLALNVLKNLVAWELSRQSRSVGRLLEAGALDQARFVLAALRDLIHGLRREVAGWSGDSDLAADEEILARYIAALQGPAQNDPVAQKFVADSLRYTAHRKQHSQAER